MRIYLLSFFAIGIRIASSLDSYSMGYFQIYESHIYWTNLTSSLFETHQLLPSSPPTVANCAIMCLYSTRCRTTVFNTNTNICMMYSEDATRVGQILSSTPNYVTIVNTERSITPLVTVDNSTVIYPVWNTSAGGDSQAASSGVSNGQYWYLYRPQNIFDGNWSSVFCSYGVCNYTTANVTCGQNTGSYLTFSRGSFVLQTFVIVTGGYGPARDPKTLTIEGSNQVGSALTLGSSWTLIYNGSAGLETDPGRTMSGIKQILVNNQLSFASYRFLFTAKRGYETCVEYGEIQLYAF